MKLTLPKFYHPLSDMDCSNDTNPNERLLDAARDGNEAVVTFFLQCNETYINVGNHDGKTPLHLASENGHASVLRLLLEQESVDVNRGDDEGETPLYAAAKLGYDDVVDILLGHDEVNVNKGRNSDGQAPLHAASENGHLGVVELGGNSIEKYSA